jgi:hypothetical protein
MNREYRFVLLDADMRPVDEITLVCPTDTDAMTVGGRFGSRRHVQVWDEDRFIGIVAASNPTRSTGAPAAQPAPVAAAPPPVEPPPAPAPEPAATSVDLSTLKLEPAEDPPAFDPSRPYNPFRRGVWRKRTGE